MLTAIEHGSVGPKRMVKTISESKAVFSNKTKIPPHDSKGKKVNIPLPRWGDCCRAALRCLCVQHWRQRKQARRRRRQNGEELSFLSKFT